MGFVTRSRLDLERKEVLSVKEAKRIKETRKRATREEELTLHGGLVMSHISILKKQSMNEVLRYELLYVSLLGFVEEIFKIKK